MKVQALDTYVRKGSYNDRGAYSLAICRLLNFPQPVVNLNHDHIPWQYVEWIDIQDLFWAWNPPLFQW